MGPDLTNIGGSRPLGMIKESVLQPSKDLTFLGNEAVTVTLTNGQVIQGLARNRSNYSLQVVDRKGALHLISMTDVKALDHFRQSPMPDGLRHAAFRTGNGGSAGLPLAPELAPTRNHHPARGRMK